MSFMEITKMHGLGNSQILVEDYSEKLEENTGLSYNEIAEALCDPNFGIASDQMLVIGNSKEADFSMRVFNKDGGEAEMCGNGIRCVAKFLFDEDRVGKRPSIDTLAGKKELEIKPEKNQVRVEMGKGKILEEKKTVEGHEGTFVSVGNPHFVIFSDEASETLAREDGPLIENASEFQPEKTNVEFAKLSSKNQIETYVWERGAGLTLACGTGACATAFAAKKKGLVDSKTEIELLGGNLEIDVDENDMIEMEGPAEYIFRGKVSDVSEIYSNLKRMKERD